MLKYRETIYENYHSNQVNKSHVDYSALLAQQSYYYAKELIPFLPQDKQVSVVDLGCGYGSFVHAAKGEGYTRIKGVDLSSEQVEVAHKLGIKEVELSSIDSYFEKNENPDIIVGIDIIEHFTKDELIHFLNQCKNHLAKGGMVLFRTPNMDAPMSSVYAFADISHELYLNKSSALQILNSVGFVNVKVYPSLIHNQNRFKDLIRSVLWWKYVLWKKLVLFASGRTWNDVVFTPNMIIKAEKA